MIAEIVSLITASSSNKLINSSGGLARVWDKPKIDTQTGVVIGYDSFPIGCTSIDECEKVGGYSMFLPDVNSAFKSFFIDLTGCRFAEVTGPKGSQLRYNFQLRFYLWVNDLNDSENSPCGYVSKYLPGVIRSLIRDKIDSTGSVFSNIRIVAVNEQPKAASLWPFKFDKSLLFHPYDNAILDINGTFTFDCTENVAPKTPNKC